MRLESCRKFASKRKRPAKNAGRFLSMRVSRIPAGAGINFVVPRARFRLQAGARHRDVTVSTTRRAGPVECSYNLARPFYASTELLSTSIIGSSIISSSLSGLVGDASTIDARSPKELHQGKPGDQRAAANAGCEEDQFFGDDLHSNACRDGDEAGGTSSPGWVVPFYRHRPSPRLEGGY